MRVWSGRALGDVVCCVEFGFDSGKTGPPLQSSFSYSDLKLGPLSSLWYS